MSAARGSPTAAASLTPPAIGAYWVGQGGHYAGIVRGRDGAPDYYLVIGGEVARGSFSAVNKHCEAYTADGHTDFTGMYRSEQSVSFGNVPELFEKAWYWSREQHAGLPDSAWYQGFFNGNQRSWLKGYSFRGRAVRRIPIPSFDHSIISGGAA